MSVRESFVRRFSEQDAKCIEMAAESHKNGIHDKPGSDHFKWAVCIVIGTVCFENPQDHPGLELLSKDAFKLWCLEEGELVTHDGDVDFIALATGRYQEYIPAHVRSVSE